MRLPKPPTLEEMQANTPRFDTPPPETPRPFWSVIIPTFDNGRYLRRTLQSVLCQALSPEEMQIELVDACSTQDNPEPLVEEMGKGRIAFHRMSSNRGSAHTMNVCIERARGQWLHILHGDDMILPGFYEAYAATIRAHPTARMVLGQSIMIDESDRWKSLYGPQPPEGGGLLPDFVQRQALRQLVLFPSQVVSRDAYEAVGGFCTLFDHVDDWDMWFRLGQYAPVGCVPRPYALYRFHGGCDTSKQQVSAGNTRETYFLIQANLTRLNGSTPTVEKQSWRSRLANEAERLAWELDDKRSTEGRYNQAYWAWLLEPKMRRLLMLFKSWAKHKLKCKLSADK